MKKPCRTCNHQSPADSRQVPQGRAKVGGLGGEAINLAILGLAVVGGYALWKGSKKR